MRGKRRFFKRFSAALLSALTIFLAIFGVTGITSNAASLRRGERISYSTYGMGDHSTFVYQVDYDGSGYLKYAYCLESHHSCTPQGEYAYDFETSAELLNKVLYYGLGGDGDDLVHQFFGGDTNKCYLATHIAANYAFIGAGLSEDIDMSDLDEVLAYMYYGTSYDICEATQIHAFIQACAEAPSIDGTDYPGGVVKVYRYSAGSQAIGYMVPNKPHGPTEIDISVPINKSGNGSLSVNGAVYGLYNSSGTELARVTLSGSTSASGKMDIKLTDSGTYYVKEIAAPYGYTKDNTQYSFYVDVDGQSLSTTNPSISISGKTASVSVSDTPLSLTPSIQVTKKGNGNQSVRGAVYTMYRYDSNTLSQNPVIATATIDTPIGGSEINMIGTFQKTFYTQDAGKWYYIEETKVPSLYQLDTSRYWFELVVDGDSLKMLPYSDQASSLVNGSTITVNPASIAIGSMEKRLYKVDLNVLKQGENKDPRATLNGAIYTLYSCDSTSSAETTKKEIQKIPLTQDGTDPYKASGATSKELLPGTYFVEETTVPHGYDKDPAKHFFSISDAGVISSSDAIYTVSGSTITANVKDTYTPVPFTGEIEIIKSGSCNVAGEDSDISKAKFGLFDENDTLLQEISLSGSRIKASGKISYQFEKLGTYYIKETETPANFDLDKTKYTFVVSLVDKALIPTPQNPKFVVNATHESSATLTVDNIPNKYEWNLKVYKTAETSGDFTSLDDVEYGLFKADGTLISTCTLKGTNKGATGEFDSMIFKTAEEGSYYVQETKTVNGFRLNDKKYPFTVSVKNQKLTPSISDINVLENTAIVNAVDESEKGTFTFVKKGEDDLPILGAKFEVYLKSLLPYDDETGLYDFDAVSPYQVLSSDAKGVVVSKELNLGTYIIREIEVRPEYEIAAPFEVEIKKDLEVVEIGDIIDENVPILIRCTKKDSGRDTIVLKAGTTYEIKNSAEENVKDKNGNTNFVCDDSGVILIDALLKPDTYTVMEVIPPNQYKADSKAVVVKVDGNLDYVVENGMHIHDVTFENTEKLGQITITKTGKTLTKYEKEKFIWEEAPLPNATFEVHAGEDIYSPDNQGVILHQKDDLVGSIITGEDGSATITDLHLGKYYLVETIAPIGYVLDETPIEVILSDTDSFSDLVVESRTKFDEKQNVLLDLYKFDNETKHSLQGAKFGLYADGEIKNFAGETILKSGDFIAFGVSDENGKLIFDIDLPYAKYMVKEEQAPWGYVINPTQYSFEAVYPESRIESITIKGEWGNDTVKGDVTFIKIGETLTGFKDGKFIYETKSLKGAEFDVYANEVYTYDHAVDKDGKRTTYYKKDELIEHIKVDDLGIAKIENYPIGSYYLKETKAPYGMTILDRYDFVIQYKDQYTPKVLSKESILNDRQKIVLDVIKEEKNGNGRKLSGGTFYLYAEEDIKNINDDIIVAKGTKIAETAAVKGEIDFGLDLPHGKYCIKEIKAPGDYFENEDTFHIDTDYKDQNIKENGVKVTIYDDLRPGFGRLVLNMGQKFFKSSKNNYVTGDSEGNAGYSVLIGENSEINKTSAPAALYFGIAAAVLAIVGMTLIFIARKKRESSVISLKGNEKTKGNGGNQ